MKVIFESQGRGKMVEKWLHKNVNISPKKAVTCETFYKHKQKKRDLLQVKIFQDADDQFLSNLLLTFTIFH